MARRTFIERSILPFIVLGGTLPCWDRRGDSPYAPRSASAATAAAEGEADSAHVARRRGDEPAVFAPTLDTPLPRHGSAVWTAGLALAWSALRERVAPGPLSARGAEALARSLDGDAASAPDEVPERSGYAAAGRIHEGVLEADAFAYARVEVDATLQNVQGASRAPLRWKDSRGRALDVRSFGFSRRGDAEGAPRILYDGGRRGGGELALDLASDASPVQVIVALVHRERSLGETVRALDDRIARYRGRGELDEADGFAVPCVRLDATHRFGELEGRSLEGPGVPGALLLSSVVESVSFRLDGTGSRVPRESAPAATHLTRAYVVDGPFLVLAKKRGADRPFLVLWVDGPELLAGAASG